VEACAQLQQTGDASSYGDTAFIRIYNFRQQFQCGAFAAAVASDNTHGLAPFYVKADPLKNPKTLIFIPATGGSHNSKESAKREGKC